MDSFRSAEARHGFIAAWSEEMATGTEAEDILTAFERFIRDKHYPCVAARAALSRGNTPCFIATDMRTADDDKHILRFLYNFISDFRKKEVVLQSAAVIFKSPERITEEAYEQYFWQRLQALAQLDAVQFGYDPRVSADPLHPNFSFSLAREAFFIIGLHAANARPARQFSYPAIIFNPHVQFDHLRKAGQYEKMKSIVRKRDKRYSGSVNPMLRDFGEASEAMQYTGREYNEQWGCPLHITHGNKDHSTEK